MAMTIKKSTAITAKIGPFLDDTDGKTAETGLTIAQADVRLTKNGGDFAQKNETTSCTHDELGFYDCPLDATDTGSVGRLQLVVSKSGALPVWHEFMVEADPITIWHVAKTGSDSNNGHSYEYAKLTIGAAVAAAAAGDKIIVWPGTYNEQIVIPVDDLTIEGMGWGTIITYSTTGSVLSLDDGSVVKNIQIINTGTPTITGHCLGIKIDAKSNCQINRCYVTSSGRGIYIYVSDKFRIRNSIINGSEYGVSAVGTSSSPQQGLIENSFINTSNWTICDSAAVHCMKYALLINNSILKSYVTSADSSHLSMGLDVFALIPNVTRVNINNSAIYAKSGNGAYERGIFVDRTAEGQGGAELLANNCHVCIDGTSNCYALVQNGYGTLCVNHCNYDATKTSGVIIDDRNSIKAKTDNLPEAKTG